MFDQNQTNPYMMNGAFNYNGYNEPQPKIMNNLTPEEIKMLQQNRSQFSLGLTEKETLQAGCNHRLPDGSGDSLTFDPDTGIARCTICGYEFRPVEPDATFETIKDSADRIVDILQTIKIMYTDLPRDAAREYFQIIPLIEKVPELFQFAAKTFAKHSYNAWNYNNSNMNGVQMFNQLNNLFGGGGFGYQPQPNFQQPMGGPAPFMNAPQQPMGMGNPFGYPGAQPGYQPQMAGYQYQPGAPAPVAPTVVPGAPAPAPAVDADATVTQTVTV